MRMTDQTTAIGTQTAHPQPVQHFSSPQRRDATLRMPVPDKTSLKAHLPRWSRVLAGAAVGVMLLGSAPFTHAQVIWDFPKNFTNRLNEVVTPPLAKEPKGLCICQEDGENYKAAGVLRQVPTEAAGQTRILIECEVPVEDRAMNITSEFCTEWAVFPK